MIDKFLNTENASITIEYSDAFDDFINNNLKDILNINLKRFIIIVDYKDVEKLIKKLNKHNFLDLPVFIKIKNFDFNNKRIEDYKNKYYLIVMCNLTNIKNIDEDIYYELNVNYEDKDKLLFYINNYENIIINMNTDINNIVNVYDALQYINNNTTSEYLLFENTYILKDLIKECPYNIYLGNRNYGNMIPRNIYIDNNNVYASMFKYNGFIIGTLDNKLSDIYLNAKKTKGYKNFIECNKKLFINYLNQFPYDFIDYNFMLKEVIDNDTSS